MSELPEKLRNKRVNRHQGTCAICGAMVPKMGGTAFDCDGVAPDGQRVTVTGCVHLICETMHQPMVAQWTVETENGPVTMIQNRNGRCEDAPCCGCCYP